MGGADQLSGAGSAGGIPIDVGFFLLLPACLPLKCDVLEPSPEVGCGAAAA